MKNDKLTIRFTKEYLEEKFNEYNEKYFNNKVPYVDINWNNRYTRTGGSCTYICKNKLEKNKTNKETLVPMEIQISTKYIKQYPDEFSDILVHEMIHILCPENGHTRFQKMARELNERFDELNVSEFNHNVYWRYIYKCSDCGHEVKEGTKMRSDCICSCGGNWVLMKDRESKNY